MNWQVVVEAEIRSYQLLFKSTEQAFRIGCAQRIWNNKRGRSMFREAHLPHGDPRWPRGILPWQISGRASVTKMWPIHERRCAACMADQPLHMDQSSDSYVALYRLNKRWPATSSLFPFSILPGCVLAWALLSSHGKGTTLTSGWWTNPPLPGYISLPHVAL